MAIAAPLFLGEEEQGGTRGRPAPKAARRLSAVGDESRAAAPGGAVSLLLVEDDPAMRLLCAYNLEAAGFRVRVAVTGREAIDLVAEEQPDVVLLDVMLPDLGGFEVAQLLPNVPIVFLSARASESDLRAGRRAGAIDYVTKPFDPVALPARLREDLWQLELGGDADSVWAFRFGRDAGRAG